MQAPRLLPCPAQAQSALGSMGFPVLMHVLQDDREDVELVRGALECLLLAMGGGEELDAGVTPGEAAGTIGPAETQLVRATPHV